jgi:hypothetical protein
MFADTLTVLTKTLVKINQDKYSSEYRFNDGSVEIFARIRHSTFNSKPLGRPVDRHNVEITHRTISAAPTPDIVFKTYAVMEIPNNGTAAAAGPILEALGDFVKDDTLQPKLLNWES